LPHFGAIFSLPNVRNVFAAKPVGRNQICVGLAADGVHVPTIVLPFFLGAFIGSSRPLVVALPVVPFEDKYLTFQNKRDDSKTILEMYLDNAEMNRG
jgi:hypothetical protein